LALLLARTVFLQIAWAMDIQGSMGYQESGILKFPILQNTALPLISAAHPIAEPTILDN
jgi:hypothetical protein